MKYNSWDYSFEIARQYYEEHGDLKVPRNYYMLDVKLGMWIYNQRRAYTKGTLSIEKIEKLNSIGMIWNSLEDRWNEMYALAKAYNEEHGDFNDSMLRGTEETKKIYCWIKKQIVDKKNGKLSDKKISLLDDINIIWNKYGIYNWEHCYNLAVQYYKENNDLLVPRSYKTESSISLGRWINTQRTKYSKGQLTQKQIDLLNEIHMVWCVKEKTKCYEWDMWYELVCDYHKENGNIDIPTYFIYKKFNIGAWLRRQIASYSKGTLTQDKIDKLNALGIVWKKEHIIKDDKKKKKLSWEESFMIALNYYKENGDLSLNYNTIYNGFNLGKWIYSQRNKRLKGELTDEQIAKLDSIEMVWIINKNLTSSSWPSAYNYALEYYNTNHNLNVKIDYVTKDGFKLGRWVENQRLLKHKCHLSLERVELLNKLDMVWNLETRSEDTWNIYYECCKQYYERYHDLKITVFFKTDSSYKFNDVALGRWLAFQKFLFKNNELSVDKIDKLNKLGIDWKINVNYSFEKIFALAKKYYETYGDLLIPNNYITNNTYEIVGYDLSEWVCRQRYLASIGKLSQDKIDRLSSIGMIWNYVEEKWDIIYNRIYDYYTKYGDLKFERLSKVEQQTFKNWINSQRKYYRDGRLDKDKVNKLKKLGLNLEKRTYKWMESYMLLKEYYDKHGNIDISTVYITDEGYYLGRWLASCKHSKRAGKLKEEQIYLLEKLNIDWTLSKTDWEEVFLLAYRYYEANGNLSIDKDYVTEDGINLGRWLYTQKINYSRNILSDKKVKLLEQLNIEWLEKSHMSWNEAYGHAKEYYDNNGNLHVPYGYTVNNFNLSKWIKTQRYYYKKNMLEEYKIELLSNIGMIWNIRKNNDSIVGLCRKYGIMYYKNSKELKRISYKELNAKILFCLENNMNYIDENGLLTDIFFMSSINFIETYGISVEQLISKYEKVKRL